jgi:hypothetical protein
MSRVIALWLSIYGDAPVKVMDLVNACNTAIEKKDTESKEYELAQVFLEITHGKGRLESEPIGKWLRRNKNNIRDGYKFITGPDSEKRNRVEWILTRK